jgi:acetolactate synthase, small subunit
MKYVLSVLVENSPGVLSKVVSLFSRRGYNIDSLTVAASEDPAFSHMTIVGEGENYTLEQVEKQLNKLIPVIKVREVKGSVDAVREELIFIKVNFDKKKVSEISEIVKLAGAEVAAISAASITVKFSGEYEKCENLCELMRPFGIRRIVRSGIIAIESGN